MVFHSIANNVIVPAHLSKMHSWGSKQRFTRVLMFLHYSFMSSSSSDSQATSLLVSVLLCTVFDFVALGGTRSKVGAPRVDSYYVVYP